MALVPLEGEPSSRDADVLLLTYRQVQQAGVRLGGVSRRDLAREIDATGRLAVDERRYAKITSWIPGRSRIERLYVDFTGAEVEKGAPLVEVYSPALVTSIRELQIAADAARGASNAGDTSGAKNMARQSLEAARQKLVRFGLSEEQVAALEAATDEPSGIPTIPIHSPMGGTVLERHCEEGHYVEEGQPLLRIADLSRLWLFADVYEHELPFVEVGQTVEITTRSLPGQTFRGEVAFIDPTVQERTRAIQVRCDIPNPEGLLKPGMYVRALLRKDLPGILSVPESAVIPSGRRDVVLLAEGEGRFRPRSVRIGRRFLVPMAEDQDVRSFGSGQERYHEVLVGLDDGDRVVVAGVFLLHAEAQFQGILKKMIDPSEPAPGPLPDAARTGMERLLKSYLAMGAALVEDDIEEARSSAEKLENEALEVGAVSQDGGSPGIRSTLGGISKAASEATSAKDLGGIRRAYAALSRQVIGYLRDFDPQLVEQSELHLFRCPMANDEERAYGYDLWVQESPDLANPYMGPLMPG